MKTLIYSLASMRCLSQYCFELFAPKSRCSYQKHLHWISRLSFWFY